MSNSSPNQKGFAPIFLIIALLGALTVGGVIGVVYYTGTKLDNSPLRNFKMSNLASQSDTSESSASAKDVSSPQPQSSPSSKSAYEILKSRTAPGFSSSNSAPANISAGNLALAQVTPPASYGYTKMLELPVVGAKAKFPESAELYLATGDMYIAHIGDDSVGFSLENYDGGGRRAWFQKNHPGEADTFETFSGKNNSGYLAYLKTGIDKNKSGSYYYFTAAGSNKMLVVSGNNYSSNFFNSDLSKLKSFVSTIELTTVNDPKPNGLTTSDVYKWSDIRKTVWEDSSLGLKITSPEWIDYRNSVERDVNGNYKFDDWKRSYFDNTKTYDSALYQNNYETTNVDVPYAYTADYLTIIKSEYKNQDFNDLVYGILLPGGFCSTEWKTSKSECSDPNSDFCYSKDDVVQNLKVIKTAKIGELSAQLRGIDSNFSFIHDCRGEDTWIIKARDGRFVLSDIPPDGEILKIEKN